MSIVGDRSSLDIEIAFLLPDNADIPENKGDISDVSAGCSAPTL